jgi:DNA-binding XRE family transcriptional regulator
MAFSKVGPNQSIEIRRLLALYIPQWYKCVMIIGDRLRELREEKNLSQGDIEKRTGLLRCYISRVENGHTVPANRNPGKKWPERWNFRFTK